MARLGFGVVGVKGMGQGHCRAMAATNSAALVAVMDINHDAARRVAGEFGVTAYSDFDALLEDRAVEVVDICTPHVSHPDLAIRALEAGRMVLVEKPMAISLTEADAMVQAGERTRQPLGVVFQYRTRAINRRFRDLVAEAGDLYRTAMVFTGLRTQAYYEADAWRGTWSGEGGGVLVNQAPHGLDLFQWFFGMPVKVLAWTRTRAHAIGVEDQAFAQVEYPSGTVGTWIANTTDVPGTNRVEAFGARSAVRLGEDGVLMRGAIEPPLDEFLATSKEMWGQPKVTWETIEVPEIGGRHADVIEEYCQAVMKGQRPPVDGEEGRKSVELACAMTLSSARGRAVRLPVARKAYDDVLARFRRAEARPRGRGGRAAPRAPGGGVT